MPISLFRIDERLLHGQVIVGWGVRLRISYYVVVDDRIAESEWEQELYGAGLPKNISVYFLSEVEAIDRFSELDALPGVGALLTRGTGAMRALAETGRLQDRRVNVGGLHDGPGRRAVLDYVYLRDAEVDDLRVIAELARSLTARDLPTATEVELDGVLHAAD
ncbi:MAG: PTS sugar transporter subunit IIB [Gemmatimonadota bacterium]